MKLLVFLCQFCQWCRHIAELGYELCTICGHAKETADTAGCGRCWCIIDCLNFWGVGCNSFAREHESKKCHRGFVKLTFLFIECEIDLCKFLAHRIKGCIVVGLCLPKDNDVVTDVKCTRDISELVLNGLLKNLTGRVSAKIESSLPPESLVCCECGDVSTLGS